MILRQYQAEAVYHSMCTLNNIGARVQVKNLDTNELQILERDNGMVVIGYLIDDDKCGIVEESYESQAAFAAAYNLPQPAMIKVILVLNTP